MEKNEYLLKLLKRISEGTATDEDLDLYNRWCRSFQGNGRSVSDIEGVTKDMLLHINRQIHQESKARKLRVLPKIAVAASIVMTLFFGGLYLIHSQQKVEKNITLSNANNVAPGGNKAVLTLANGKEVILDSVHIGKVASQGNSSLTKINSGLLIYRSVKGQAKDIKLGEKSPIKYNTLKIPRGGQFQLILPDGTKVWLNSTSSIHFPTAFTGEKRKVAITGEVYFEVARKVNKPFIVIAKNTSIKVLGTHFNVMAYNNEPAVLTTLLEGSVKVTVSETDQTTILRPGQQAQIDKKSKKIEVKKVDAHAVAAWIHGSLSMKNCTIKEFMNKLSRWYDVDVVFKGKIPQKRLGGLLDRNVPLSNVLSALKAAGIHTKYENKKIFVLPN